MSLLALARGGNNPHWDACGRAPQPIVAPWVTSLGTGDDDMEDRKHVIMHPSITPADTDGRGYYEYPHNPDLWRGFMYHPLRRVDFVSVRTGDSSVGVATVQAWEDVAIQEIWLADNSRSNVISEMFRVFHEYYVRVPSVGHYVGWCPFSRSFNRYNVQIVSVDLGPPQYEYNDVKQKLSSYKETYQAVQLTLTLKLVKRAVPPRSEITFEGV